jgi:ComF family protein
LKRNVFRTLKQVAGDLYSLLYPDLCASCNQPLFKGEKEVCSRCRAYLAYNRFHDDKENPVAQVFWGRIRIENATAFFTFRKGSRIQKILHKLKYQNQQSLGVELGRWFGAELSKTDFNAVDCIAPVPLHPRKLRKRGYNQAELIAKGLAETLEKPLLPHLLKRIIENPTQTHKNKFERWLNVDGIFDVNEIEKLSCKHVLIVDDVITTGSTLEACAHAILKVPGTKVSVAVLAMA